MPCSPPSAFGSYYLSRPDLETLYIGLNAQDVSRIGAALKEAGITFDVNSQGNAVLVRRGQTAQARMLLAEKGLPTSANAGYELFDKMGSMGLTSFMQEITRVRALEGEIARTIQAMKGVKAARVHIVLPDAGSFRRARQAALGLRHHPHRVGRRFSSGPGHPAPGRRRRARHDGRPGDGAQHRRHHPGLGRRQRSTPRRPRCCRWRRRSRKELQDNVRKTLAPYLGLDNFEISVAARLNTDKRQINETNFNPEVQGRALGAHRQGNRQLAEHANRPQAVGVEQNVPADQATPAAPAATSPRSRTSGARS